MTADAPVDIHLADITLESRGWTNHSSKIHFVFKLGPQHDSDQVISRFFTEFWDIDSFPRFYMDF